MKVVYENDAAKGPGYGFFCLREVRLEPPVEDCRFSVRRSSDRQCLMAGGWQDAERPLAPEGVSARDGDLLLAVGPAVVDQLDELETYRLTVFAADGTREAGILELRGVVYSPMHGGGSVSGVTERPQTPPPPQPPVVPAPVVPEEDAAATAAVEEPLVEEVVTPPSRPTSVLRSRWLWAAVCLLVVVLAAAGWWYWRQHRQATPVAAPAPEPAASTEAPAPTPPPTDAAVPAAEKAAPADKAPEPPLAQARAFLRAKGAPDQALALSQRMPQTPDGRDAAFLLLNAAAEGGQSQAMLLLARFYDPTDTAPAGTIVKDAAQARVWYAKARDAGEADAPSRLDALDAWLRQQADKGDARAKDILDGKP